MWQRGAAAVEPGLPALVLPRHLEHPLSPGPVQLPDDILGQSNFPHNQSTRGTFDPDKLGVPPEVNWKRRAQAGGALRGEAALRASCSWRRWRRCWTCWKSRPRPSWRRPCARRGVRGVRSAAGGAPRAADRGRGAGAAGRGGRVRRRAGRPRVRARGRRAPGPAYGAGRAGRRGDGRAARPVDAGRRRARGRRGRARAGGDGGRRGGRLPARLPRGGGAAGAGGGAGRDGAPRGGPAGPPSWPGGGQPRRGGVRYLGQPRAAEVEPPARTATTGRRCGQVLVHLGAQLRMAVQEHLRKLHTGRLLEECRKAAIAANTYDPYRAVPQFLFDLLRQPGEENRFFAGGSPATAHAQPAADAAAVRRQPHQQHLPEQVPAAHGHPVLPAAAVGGRARSQREARGVGDPNPVERRTPAG